MKPLWNNRRRPRADGYLICGGAPAAIGCHTLPVKHWPEKLPDWTFSSLTERIQTEKMAFT